MKKISFEISKNDFGFWIIPSVEIFVYKKPIDIVVSIVFVQYMINISTFE